MRAPVRLSSAAVVALAVVAGVVSDVPLIRPAPAVVDPTATVTVYGREGTFGSLGDMVPSGQQMSRVAVPGWEPPAARDWSASVFAADGTVLVATADASVGVYDPRDHTYSRVAVPGVGDLEPVAGGTAVVFAAWPHVGVLTKVDGRWRVTGDQPVGDGAGVTAMAVFPASHDIIIAHSRAGADFSGDGSHDAELTALRLAGPDAAGRFTATVRGRYAYRGRGHDVSLRDVQADPTGRPGDERFAVGLDVWHGKAAGGPSAIQQFRYDAATGAITPLTAAPVIPGDRDEAGALYAYSAFVYDRAGDLWVARRRTAADIRMFMGGKLAVYPKDGPRCGARRVSWAQACPPRYDILQAKELLAVRGLAVDPSTGDVVALTIGDVLLPIRWSRTGPTMTFRIGNVVDIGRKLLPAADVILSSRTTAVDPAHRLWLPVGRWLYAVDLTDLFEPAPVTLPDTPGWAATVQAERTLTTGTLRRASSSSTVEIGSTAYVGGCPAWPANVGCAYDDLPGDGFVLRDQGGFGHLHGDLDYRVRVSTPGTFRLSYRVGTFPNTPHVRITLTVAGRSYTTPVSTGGGQRTIVEPRAVELPAGVQTIRLSVPENGGGWFLNSFTLVRS